MANRASRPLNSPCCAVLNSSLFRRLGPGEPVRRDITFELQRRQRGYCFVLNSRNASFVFLNQSVMIANRPLKLRFVERNSLIA